MDKKDKQILVEIQRDARQSTAEIADKVGLSVSPCARRIKKLESDGMIAGYQASLDRQKLGLMMTFFVNVSLNNHRDQPIDAFEQVMTEMPEVISAHVISGAHDYLLEVVARDLPHYESFIRQLQRLTMVKDIHTNLAIRTVKTGQQLPI
ncbi:Lrp/AsnC family transcriptional regulator [Photobacterium sp. 1_MG-2023]|uniref:Lrp/AsnC family transcriptional regulator n=1 Tax=Photobacterium sp. 1_MG-2023 TaxID=3062646 RepID=UPI0026E1BF0C|nr:Lrp/AsnC family transcriptional regulator [Photobacterium sp. 1_MG-2023]MDO6708885.1 Lrp/AsnC family transcriptional regulator [Photobacterium sp. 1_MG-2023]